MKAIVEDASQFDPSSKLCSIFLELDFSLIDMMGVDSDCWNVSYMKQAIVSMWFALFPAPDSVREEYWPWIQWRLLQRFFSTSLTLFGTQSLLMAAGIKARESLTASIVINWMVKDGIGRIARLVIAAKFSQTFDTDIKRARILSMFFYSICVTGDYLTPIFPSCFLLLAAISNIGKAVAFTAFVSTAPALIVIFAKQKNIADITAKHQALYSVVDSLSIAVAAILTHCCSKSPSMLQLLPFVAYGICAFLSLYTLNAECKTLVFHTLSQHRLVLLSKEWVAQTKTSSPEKVSDEESSILANLIQGRNRMNIRIGSLEDMVDCPQELNLILNRHQTDAFFVSLKRSRSGRSPHTTILITFREGHQDDDIIRAFLAASYASAKFTTLKRNALTRSEISTIFAESTEEAKLKISPFKQSLMRNGWDLDSVYIPITDIQQRQLPQESTGMRPQIDNYHKS